MRLKFIMLAGVLFLISCSHGPRTSDKRDPASEKGTGTVGSVGESTIRKVRDFFPLEVNCNEYTNQSGQVVHSVKASGLAGEGAGDIVASASDENGVNTTNEIKQMCDTLKAAVGQNNDKKSTKKKSFDLTGQHLNIPEPEGESHIFWFVLLRPAIAE